MKWAWNIVDCPLMLIAHPLRSMSLQAPEVLGQSDAMLDLRSTSPAPRGGSRPISISLCAMRGRERQILLYHRPKLAVRQTLLGGNQHLAELYPMLGCLPP